ncbi:aminotransferase class III-fold pyridoxal phosphate-dependent enzyme [Flagellimonas olearia]|uniref:Aminotransferase class III-fold pyridoxal phosphate-dependent enzyme n=1 Tax=Flagellimonas olearia TaxID=552546 RepID=A0A6I1E224_9FLAO|nr:aminotransferase class III-fold pyridoxal phosphate-dependent enzyme [Allomuricauda olearia]KAB7531237.1 aminotransferase class III-fold pyridoxal phosphate-dependent enzyme [Allomuricauda olearia]
MSKEDFFTYQAQTSPHPLGLEISHAKGSYIYDTDGNAHLDFVAGVSACGLGHCHPKVVKAIKDQVDRYMHVMVYGEYVQQPAVEFTKLLAAHLPKDLETTYLVNSGTEAMEGALKLARRYTGRTQIIAAHRAYHGNTMGSLSIMGFEERKSAFRPLLPDVRFINFNAIEDLEKITDRTAAVVLETIQGGAGFILPQNGYLEKVRERCNEVGALLILDEIQPGFGRTGKLFAFEHFNCIPDILVIGKGMASGLPVGAFVASHKMMSTLQDHPKLGHITTFGGNPVIAAASLATLQEITGSQLIEDTLEKEKLFRKLLVHPLIEEIRGKGLMLALLLQNKEIVDHLILTAAKEGLILFWLLFEPKAVRISPPLTISMKEIEKGCDQILDILNRYKPATVN